MIKITKNQNMINHVDYIKIKIKGRTDGLSESFTITDGNRQETISFDELKKLLSYNDVDITIKGKNDFYLDESYSVKIPAHIKLCREVYYRVSKLLHKVVKFINAKTYNVNCYKCGNSMTNKTRGYCRCIEKISENIIDSHEICKSCPN